MAISFPGNSPLELAPYIVTDPGESINSTPGLTGYMRRVLSSEEREKVIPVWAGLVRSFLHAHGQQQTRYGMTTSSVIKALSRQPGDLTVLRYFLLLAGEMVI